MEDECDEALPLKVTSGALRMVEKFCKYHKENPKEKSVFHPQGKIDNFKKFDKDFTDELKKDVTLLFETLAAADYLDYRYMVDVVCRAIAILIKGQSEDQIRETFSLFFSPPATFFFVSFFSPHPLSLVHSTEIPKVSEEKHEETLEKHPLLKKY